MTQSRTKFRLLVPALVALLAACSGQAATAPSVTPTTPADGWLTLQLSTPNRNDGAVQFSVSGPGIDSVDVLGYNGIATVDAGGANLVVTGQVTTGDVARIHVTNLAYTSSYQATVVAAAANASYNLQQLTGYRAVLVR